MKEATEVIDDRLGASDFLREGRKPAQIKIVKEEKKETADQLIWRARMILAGVQGRVEDIIEGWLRFFLGGHLPIK